MNSLLYSFFATILISLISLISLGLFVFKSQTIHRSTLILVAFAIGSLLGDAFIHLIPESFEIIESPLVASLLIICGILLFFIIEKILRWHHCHDPECQDSNHEQHIVALNMLGDTVHNFIDGLLIAGSFYADFRLGVTTTLAVILHEIPQEIGDFGVFIHHGLSISRSVKLNLLSGLSSLVGVFAVGIIGNQINDFSNYLLPLAAGGFIYLALSDLVPELHAKSKKNLSSITHTFFILLGIGLMSLLLLLE